MNEENRTKSCKFHLHEQIYFRDKYHNTVPEYIYHHNTTASSSISRKSRFAQTTIRGLCVLTVSIYVTQGCRYATFISV